MSRFLSVIIKPTLACNMGCRHCYHTPEERSSGGRISFERLEKLFRLVSEEYDGAWFIWHGGEPLTLPFSFFKKAIELQEKYFGTGKVGNTIQTNGLALDNRMVKFCKEKMINIGISHEGPCADILRHDGRRIEDLIVGLSDKERAFAVSATISKESQSRQAEIYDHFNGIGASISMVPVIPAGCAAKNPGLVPDPDEYIRSSIEVFDKWFNDPDARIPLAPHYLYVLTALGDPQPSDCAHTSCLTKWVCIYPNGDLYPCAKACPEEFRMCSIDGISHMSDAFRTDGFARMLKGSIERRAKCQSCDIYDYCQGGCSIDAYYQCGIGNRDGDSCRIYRDVFRHVKKEVDAVISEKKDLSRLNPMVRDAILGKLVNPMINGV